MPDLNAEQLGDALEFMKVKDEPSMYSLSGEHDGLRFVALSHHPEVHRVEVQDISKSPAKILGHYTLTRISICGEVVWIGLDGLAGQISTQSSLVTAAA